MVNQAEPITTEILRALHPRRSSPIRTERVRIDDLNFDVASKVAFAGLLWTREFTYDEAELVKVRDFQNTHLPRSDVTFSKNNDHIVIRLKKSKTDYKHKGVNIVIAAVDDEKLCVVKALRRLLKEDKQPRDAPLFRFYEEAFSYSRVVAKLKLRLLKIGITNASDFGGHSWRRGGAEAAETNGITKQELKELGRWDSSAFEAYCAEDSRAKFELSTQFLTGTTVPFTSNNYTTSRV